MLFDLLPQLTDIDAQILSILDMRWSPHRSEDLLVCYDASRMPRQKRQKLEFLWRKPEVGASARCSVTDRIDLEITDPQCLTIYNNA